MVDRQEVFDDVVDMLYKTAKELYANAETTAKNHMISCIKELTKLLKLDEIIDVLSGEYDEEDKAIIDGFLKKEGE